MTTSLNSMKARANLSGKELKQQGFHPVWSEVRLSQLLACWVVHDLNHLGEISIGKKQVRGGPIQGF